MENDSKVTLFDSQGKEIDLNSRSFYIEKHGGAVYTSWSDFFQTFSRSQTYLPRLPIKVCRRIYIQSSIVRPVVDSIIREIAGIPFYVDKSLPTVNDEDVSRAMAFLTQPNPYEDFSIFITKFLSDILVAGMGYIQKVYSQAGNLVSLIARDSDTFSIKLDDTRTFPTGYVQQALYGPVNFELNEIVCRQWTPTTYNPYGPSILESILNEVSLIMLSVRSIGESIVRDEVPPGILHLGNIGGEAYERLKESFLMTKSHQGMAMKVVDNVDKVEWVPFTRPFRELQVAELLPIILGIVGRNFGLPAEEFIAKTEKGFQTAKLAQVAIASALINPLQNMIASMINLKILPYIAPGVVFTYTNKAREDYTVKAGALSALYRSQLITLNEARSELGKATLPDGDKLYTPANPFGGFGGSLAKEPHYDFNGDIGEEDYPIQGNNEFTKSLEKKKMKFIKYLNRKDLLSNGKKT